MYLLFIKIYIMKNLLVLTQLFVLRLNCGIKCRISCNHGEKVIIENDKLKVIEHFGLPSRVMFAETECITMNPI